jgi:hypothetical protein
VGAEEEHGGNVALDPHLREMLAMSRVGSEVVEELVADLDQEQMTRDCSSQILVHQRRWVFQFSFEFMKLLLYQFHVTSAKLSDYSI